MKSRIDYEEAIRRIYGRTEAKSDTCLVPLLNAYGRILAEPVYAPISVPTFRRSAMDGYGVRSSDVSSADPERPAVLQVAGTIFAGDGQDYELRPGEAYRIMTGARLPKGADLVIRQEDSDYGREAVRLFCGNASKTNICEIGEDMQKGQLLLSPYTFLRDIHIGILAGIGMAQVAVVEPLKVGILSVGTEILDPGQTLGSGQIYNSNGYFLAARLQSMGFTANPLTSVPDDTWKIVEEMETQLRTSDLVLTIGGVSVGEKDLMPEALERLGAEVQFHNVNIQPGTHVLAARKDGKWILCLSGNPYASIVNFDLFFGPIAAIMMGCPDFQAAERRAVMQEDYRKLTGMRRFLRAYSQDGQVWIPVKRHNSSLYSNLVECNCYIDIPPQTALGQGDEVTVVFPFSRNSL